MGDFRCLWNESICVASSFLRDGVSDCADNSDEVEKHNDSIAYNTIRKVGRYDEERYWKKRSV